MRSRTYHRLALFIVLACATRLRADAIFLIQEPYGAFGSVNPTGHAAVYLPRVCADRPTVLRRCAPGELGIVLSRYSRISGYDWLAIPLIPYLYAVERAEQIPDKATAETVSQLRDDYRRKYLEPLAPDHSEGEIPGGSWVELVGAAYNRKIYGFQIDTTEAQDERLISVLNSHKNKSHFNLFVNNCADFSRRILNIYYPGAAHRNFVGDAGITTPKHLAECLVRYHQRHPDIHLSAFFIAQVPGSRPSSHKLDSVCEAFVKTKKYMVPMTVLHPVVAGVIFAGYLAGGHFNVTHYAETEFNVRELAMTASSSRPSSGSPSE